MSSANIIIDNTRSDFFSYHGAWTTSPQLEQWFNQSVSSPNASNSSVTLTFNGTSVALIGSTPPSSDPQSFTISIDNNTAFNTSYSDLNPPSYRQWYQSPTLSDGIHTIALSNLSASSIDFAVVTVGPQTPLTGEFIVVDDADSAISYSSGWRTDKDKFTVGGSTPIIGSTFRNSTHATETVGSSFSYTFSGTSISIYGVFDWSSPGLFSFSLSIDSQAPLYQDYQVTTSSPQFQQQLGQEPNFLLYFISFLPSAEHTLVVNLTDCINTTFSFDYLTYTPTFSDLSDMPPATTSSPASGSSGHKSSSAVGAAIGAVIGSLSLALFLFLFWRRTRRRNLQNEGIRLWAHKPTAAANESPIAHSNSPLLATQTPALTPMPTPLPTSASLPQPNPNRNSELGPMALRQNASAVQYGLNFDHAGPPGQTWDTHPTVHIDPPSYEEVASA